MVVAVTLCLLRVPAGAQEAGQNDLFQSLSLSSRKEPIQINADGLDFDYKASTITYRGSVQVTQADVTLTSDRLIISYDPEAVRGGEKGKTARPSDAVGGAGRIKEVVAEGHVRIRQRERLAEGRRAVFDQAKQTIVLSDGAVLHDGRNQVAGERIVVYLQEERSVVESGTTSRVKAVFYPGKEDGGEHRGEATPAVQAARREEPAPQR
jgi:lipopolysaccharide export system protein LptA